MWRFFGRVSQFIRTALANSLEALFVSNSNSRSSRTRGIEAPWRSGVRGVFIAEEALRRFEIGTRRLATNELSLRGKCKAGGNREHEWIFRRSLAHFEGSI